MATGQDIVNRALTHVTDPREPYVYGAFVPKDAPHYRGPWDCAEFASKMYFEETGILYGTSNHIDPRTADAWSGFWLKDAQEKGRLIKVAEAARTPGAVILRVGVGIIGHVVIADGRGGTIEAACQRLGVTRLKVSGRRWTHGVMGPGVAYAPLGPVSLVPARVIRLTDPYTTHPVVGQIQRLVGLKDDNIYGPVTHVAVLNFQRLHGLVMDGEVGPQTLTEMGINPGRNILPMARGE
jgi:hypothetical protein